MKEVTAQVPLVGCLFETTGHVFKDFKFLEPLEEFIIIVWNLLVIMYFHVTHWMIEGTSVFCRTRV